MGWMAPLRHLGAKVLVGENQSADKEPSMNEITTAATRGQRLHRAEADITKRRNRSGFDPNADIGLLLARQQHTLGFSTFQVCPKDRLTFPPAGS